MSSFLCEYCGEKIIDTPRGYITGCKHFPLKRLSPDQLYRHQQWLKGLKTIEEKSR